MAPDRLLINEALCPSIPQPVTQRGRINLHRLLVRSGPVQDTHQCVCMFVLFNACLCVFGHWSHVRKSTYASLLVCDIRYMSVFECMCDIAWVEEVKH